jgi:hypothetical protein
MTEIRYTHEVQFEHYEVMEARRELEAEQAEEDER